MYLGITYIAGRQTFLIWDRKDPDRPSYSRPVAGAGAGAGAGSTIPRLTVLAVSSYSSGSDPFTGESACMHKLETLRGTQFGRDCRRGA